jgi:WD40 repeat protein
MSAELDCHRADPLPLLLHNTGIFDIRQLKLLHTIQAHEMHVRSLYIDEAGMTLCSGSGEGDMKVWNLETFEPVSAFSNLQARNRFQIQTFDRIPVSGRSFKPRYLAIQQLAHLVSSADWLIFHSCSLTGQGVWCITDRGDG